MKKEFITIRDLIPVAIFTALMFLVRFAFELVSALHPLLYIIAGLLTSILSAPIFALFLLKVKKIGGITIMSFLCGAIYMVSGAGIISLLGWVVTGILAEIIRYSIIKKPKSSIVISYAVFSLGAVSGLLPSYIQGESFFDQFREFGMSTGYVEGLKQLLTVPNLIIVILLTLILTGLAEFVAITIFKKKFEAANLIAGENGIFSNENVDILMQEVEDEE